LIIICFNVLFFSFFNNWFYFLSLSCSNSFPSVFRSFSTHSHSDPKTSSHTNDSHSSSDSHSTSDSGSHDSHHEEEHFNEPGGRFLNSYAGYHWLGPVEKAILAGFIIPCLLIIPAFLYRPNNSSSVWEREKAILTTNIPELAPDFTDEDETVE